MKVCILTHTFPRFNGDTAAPFMDELVEALVQQGHEVFVLAPYDQEIETRVKRNFKLVTYRYIFPDSFHKLGYSRTLEGDNKIIFSNILLSPFLYFFAFISLLKLVRKEKIDVISSHWIIPNGFIAALVSLITKIPFTVTIPGSDIYLGGKNFFFKWMIGFAAKRASYIISDSQFYLERLHELGFYPAKTGIIRYGVDDHKFRIASKNKNLLKELNIKNEKILLAVGRMVAKKGFEYLIEAIPEVLRDFPNTKLVLIGDGDLRLELEKKAGILKVINNIVFVGTVSYNQLQKYYSLADIFIMPSVKDEKGNIDASPVTLMIAIMSGCPFVATKFAFGQDSIGKDVGYIVKDMNSEEISKAIISLLKEGINFKMREKVRRYAIDNFSLKETARKYTDIFQKVLEINS